MNVGVHFKYSDNFMDCLHFAKDCNLSAIQIMTADFKGYFKAIDNPKLEEEFRAFQLEKNIKAVSHAPLALNLVSPEARKAKYSYNVLLYEYIRCSMLGITKIVVHPGSVEDKTTGEEQLVEVLRRFEKDLESRNLKTNIDICVETMVGAGNQLLSNLDSIKKFLEETADIPEVHLCFDTAHMYGAGYLPSVFINSLEENKMLGRVKAVHFNDSLAKMGSNKDRHAHLLMGNIPKEELIGVYNKLKDSAIFIDEYPVKKNDTISPEDEVKVLLENLK